ncbi:unnamed protein product [Kuraishia capsulata CBS 1993]|uniref:Uncharacterized protein n=1 Tax=Kuraishia capsulata CBS 1993 TaxID=1382522 RepID=W6MRV3_9ASCO|nr:uncharacterized protein KUCA_T00003952001 [Kuraishia capsulata CBS 1993]CDK27972.1 unnamed protein product [Kuraishia capsulata CBS 1993]
MPQLLEQWRLKSADGISIEFLTLWFLGDIANLAGSVWAGLLPEVILLAVWFCFTDGMVIVSYVYYTWIYPKNIKARSSTASGENEALLPGESTNGRRPSHKSHRSHRSRRSSIVSVIMEPSKQTVFVKFVLPLLFVTGAGFMGYLLSSPDSDPVDEIPDVELRLGPQVLGYISAFLYLTARLPQIYQNWSKKSCKGLSILFFIFSTFGNVTYALQILFYRSDSKYILINLSWLLGSLGTIFEDAFIFVQFYMYKDSESDEAIEDEA